MNKIELPPCESAGPEGACFWAVIGTMCGFREIPAGCPRYVPASGDYPTGFDALAAAVRRAGIYMKLSGPAFHNFPDPKDFLGRIEVFGYRVVFNVQGKEYKYGKDEIRPEPTAALVAACLKCNEEAE